MIRYLVRESMAAQGVPASAEVAIPRQLPPAIKHDNPNGVVVLCLSGPQEVWRYTISETRRTLPGGRVVAVTFGMAAEGSAAPEIDARLGADTLVQAPVRPAELREAILRAKHVKAGPVAAPTG